MHFQSLHFYRLNFSGATSAGGIFQSTLPLLPVVSQFWRFPFEVSNTHMDHHRILPLEGNWSLTPTRVLGVAKWRAQPLSDQCCGWSLREHLPEPQGLTKCQGLLEASSLPQVLTPVLMAWPHAGHKHPLLCSWKDNYLKFVLPALESPALPQLYTAGIVKPRSW